MFKKIYTLIGSLGAISTAFYPGFAYSTCEYQTETNVQYQKEVLSIKDYTQKVEDHTNNTRRCTVNMSINVDGKWYDAEGNLVAKTVNKKLKFFGKRRPPTSDERTKIEVNKQVAAKEDEKAEREEIKKKEGEPNLAISDFIAPKDSDAAIFVET